MGDLDAMWPAIESAGPDDPLPLLVAADWLDEHADDPNGFVAGARYAAFSFALRWCAGNRRRPYKRLDVIRPQWGWVPDLDRAYKRLTRGVLRERAAAVVHPLLYDQFASRYEPEWAAWLTAQAAYAVLADALAALNRVVAVPDVVLPPPRVVQLPGVVTCAGCGIVRAGDRHACPVCEREGDQ